MEVLVEKKKKRSYRSVLCEWKVLPYFIHFLFFLMDTFVDHGFSLTFKFLTVSDFPAIHTCDHSTSPVGLSGLSRVKWTFQVIS